MINVFQPTLGEEELNRIKEVFKSNWIGKGKMTEQFEKDFAKHLNVEQKNIFSTNCCSEGLFSSMKILDISPQDEVIMPTISFVGAGNAVCANGSKLVLCDVDPRTLNARAEDIEKKLTSKTKAIMILHYGGVACEMNEILQLADAHNIKVIEDSACSVASTYKGRACGTLGDMGMWSFDAMKILVCGDGSMIYLKDQELAEKAQKYLYFGLESKSGYSNPIDNKWWEYEISSFGHRAIINDVTAAMAVEQCKKLPAFIARRKEIHDTYNRELSELEWLDLPLPLKENCKSSYYFYHIQVKKEGYRDKLAKYLKEADIYTTFRYYPLHLVDFYGIHESFPNAEYATERTLCLPIHQGLTIEEQGYIIDKIKKFGERNGL